MSYLLDIKRGYIQIYVPLKFEYESMKKYKEMIEGLQNSDCVISQQSIDENGIRFELKPHFYDICDRITNTYISNKGSIDLSEPEQVFNDDEHTIKIKQTFDYENGSKIKNTDSILLKYINPMISLGDSDIKLMFNNGLEEIISEQLMDIVDTSNATSEAFGETISKGKHMLMLWPILFEDKNNVHQIATVDIEFFDLGLALCISYPIENQSSLPLVENNYNLYHESCFYANIFKTAKSLEEFDYDRISSSTIDEIIDNILSWLYVNSTIQIKTESRVIILLSQLSEKNISFPSVSEADKESIYRITNAPFPNDDRLHSERNIMWKEHFWGQGPFRHYFSSMGNCVSIVDNEEMDLFLLDDEEELNNKRIDISLLHNIENAFKVMLLTKLNNMNYLISQELAIISGLREIEEIYFLTQNYILSILDESYGSVQDLYQKMTSLCHHYLNQSSIEQRIMKGY